MIIGGSVWLELNNFHLFAMTPLSLLDGRLYRDSVIPGLAGAAEFDSNLGIIDYFVINKQFIFAEVS